jgi:hypothetical protein
VDVLYLSTAGAFDRILRRLETKVRCAIVELHIIINIELGINRSIQNIIKSPRLGVDIHLKVVSFGLLE